MEPQQFDLDKMETIKGLTKWNLNILTRVSSQLFKLTQ